jgi:MoaA/NifB/PqqE/SkfB family radical SAM enzyme
LMHSDLASLSRLLRPEGIHLTLLTAGLSLERHAARVVQLVDDLIVSVDGPQEIHDRIRGVAGAFRQLERGITAVRRLRPEMPIHGRCTVQKQNCRDLRNTVRASHTLGLNSVSFLAADVTSSAFNRPERWSPERQDDVALDANDTGVLEREIETLIREHRQEIDSGFLVEGPDKLRRIACHFRARVEGVLPASPRCNAPWVSAVIEADGTVKPCFFHEPIGNIHDHALLDVLNSAAALKFRGELDIANNPTCRNCVCSLYLPGATGA